jgi:hypothetical protein
MSGFKFRDLLPPGEAGKMAFKRALELRREQWDGDRWEYYYKGGADLILRHGAFWTGAPVPPEYEHLKGPMQQCFNNAWQAAKADPELRYVEGYYTLGNGAYVNHAWCITPDGQILDFTADASWVGGTDMHGLPVLPQESWTYWGVVIHTDLVTHHLEECEYWPPMMDRPAEERALHGATDSFGEPYDFSVNHDFPLLKVRYDPDRRTY